MQNIFFNLKNVPLLFCAVPLVYLLMAGWRSGMNHRAVRVLQWLFKDKYFPPELQQNTVNTSYSSHPTQTTHKLLIKPLFTESCNYGLKLFESHKVNLESICSVYLDRTARSIGWQTNCSNTEGLKLYIFTLWLCNHLSTYFTAELFEDFEKIRQITMTMAMPASPWGWTIFSPWAAFVHDGVFKLPSVYLIILLACGNMTQVSCFHVPAERCRGVWKSVCRPVIPPLWSK